MPATSESLGTLGGIRSATFNDRNRSPTFRLTGAANATVNLKVGLLLRSLKVADLIPPRVPRLSEVAGIRRCFFEPHQVRAVLANLPAPIADAVLCLHLTG